MKTKEVLHVINVPRHICDYVLGKEHHLLARLSAGGIVAFIGTFIGNLSVPYCHISIEVIGGILHGIGATPFIEILTTHVVKPK